MKFYPRNAGMVLKPWHDERKVQEIFESPQIGLIETSWFFFFLWQNKPVMAFGLITLSLCVAYIGYLHATQENKKDLYEAIDSEGHGYMRRKTSKWDWLSWLLQMKVYWGLWNLQLKIRTAQCLVCCSEDAAEEEGCRLQPGP